mmetsp:Transcript_689/g.1442  ORF Transcript_689/g.1442 Transcript_689/m.1442 type:complete len:253 (+) Transcript_689:113-871(+)
MAPVPLPLLLAVTCIFPFHAAYAQFPDGIDMEAFSKHLLGDHIFDKYKKDHICPTSSCPSGYTPITRWPLKLESDGCASVGALPEPGEESGMDFKHIEQCCHTKNACIQLCGSDKQKCDAVFDECMEEACESLPANSQHVLEDMTEEETEKEKEMCDRARQLMILYGQMSGCGPYDAHQSLHCECVAKEKVDEKRERVLTEFYKEYNPESVNKVKGLVEKAKGKKRAVFNNILMGLVKKYPAAIQKKMAKTK